MATDDRPASLQAMMGSKGWFNRLKNTEVAKAMVDQKEANIAVGILSRASAFASDDVLQLIETRWLPSKEFDGYAWFVLQETLNWTGKHLSIATTIIKRSDIGPFAFDHIVSTVGAAQPMIALELVLVRLQAKLEKAISDAEQRINSETTNGDNHLAHYVRGPLEALDALVDRSDGWDSLEALAKAEPKAFLSMLWPWFHSILAQYKRFMDDRGSLGFPLRYHLDFRFEEEDALGLGEKALLGALRVATETFAAQDSEEFAEWLNRVEGEDATPAQRLFANALASQPARYAQRSFEFLTSDIRRFNLGNIEDLSGTTKRLIRVASPFWSDEQIIFFAKEVRSYSPRPPNDLEVKSRQHFYRAIEQLKLELLESLPRERVSTDLTKFIEEKRRKFGDAKRGATFTGPTWVGSPMSTSEIGVANDEDVINPGSRIRL